MGLLKFLLIVIVVYYGIRFISRLLLPFLVQYLFKKTQQNMNEQFNGQQEFEEREEGDVTINKSGQSKTGGKKLDDDAGEYVDFEEID